MEPGHHVVVDGATLAAKAMGEGPPVAFLHANVADSRMWQGQMEAVATIARAIAHDRRGFGGTRAGRAPFSPVSDLLAVLDALGGTGPAILVGCSQGGRIAIEAALRHPDRVRGLVLVAPSVGGAPEPVHPPAIASLLAAQAAAEREGDLDRVNAIKARLWLDGPLAGEGRVAGAVRDLFLDMNGIALRSLPAAPSLDAAPAWHRLAELRVPALVVWGDLDFPHIQDRCRHMVAAMPDARGAVLAGTAHLPGLEQPAALTALLLPFLRPMTVRGRPAPGG
jgi:pimeloyl-ACP methyl ester carboxylesterase